MHRNTYILLIFLAVAAALVAGVNLNGGGKQSNSTISQAPSSQSPVSPPQTPATPAIYELTGCGISFTAPADHTALEGPGTSVIFTGKTGVSIMVTCQKKIPRPALADDNIEDVAFDLPGDKPATISAKIYHDTSVKDGTPVEKLIFENPVNGLDIFISGSGDTFQTLIRNLNILQ